jgi:hypothetical protein
MVTGLLLSPLALPNRASPACASYPDLGYL